MTNTATEKRDLVAEIGALQQPSIDLSGVSLPSSKSEEYRFTPIVRAIEKAFPLGLQLGSDKIVESIKEFLIPGIETSTLVLVDGKFNKELSAAAGLIAADVFKLRTERFDSGLQDPFAKLTEALSQESIHLQVAQTIEKPILLLHILTGRVPAVQSTFSVAIADRASCKLIDRTVCVGDHPVFVAKLEKIHVGHHARVDFCKIQNAPNIIEVCNSDIQQMASSHVNTFTLLLEGILVRNNLTISIDGQNCESHFHGLSLLRGETIGDHHTVVDHREPNSFSNELYKGVMDDRSKGIFNGKIYVRPHAQKTNAFQSNRNILLTEQATINTKPQLEIWADDVKCSHGCTTGQLDDEAMFYLQSRGIAKDDARAMLLYAFASETTELISIPELKAYIDSLITARLHGSTK